jgi:hypothetical protein
MSSTGGVALLNSILQSAKKTFARNLVRPGEGLLRPGEGILRPSLPTEEFSQHLAHLRHLVSKVKAAGTYTYLQFMAFVGKFSLSFRKL